MSGRTPRDRFSSGSAVTPLDEGASFDQLKDRVEAVGDRAEALVDEALEETFPASDPISPSGVG